MFDPEGRPPGGVSHWVAYGIPASVTGFAEGEVSKPSDKYVGGTSLMKLSNYFGPCTPPGPLHHYTFTLMATDLEPTALAPGLTRDEADQGARWPRQAGDRPDRHVLQAVTRKLAPSPCGEGAVLVVPAHAGTQPRQFCCATVRLADSPTIGRGVMRVPLSQ